ncbi:hypothetical protein KC19_11G132000 [Ceratodon purpureus]|uniref:Fucosyltransferase n=1 Tax=Ceratodon purpureus TaxID=3225 RepID=A0A8T0GI69_CERPU|nr:hypothetical protein KC19_11G132000 [Ceratodon purpureus]
MSTSSNELKAYRSTIVVLLLIFLYAYIRFTTDSEVKSSVEVIKGTSPNEQTDCKTTVCQQQSTKLEAARKLEVAHEKERVVRAFVAELQEATRLAAGGEDENAWYHKARWNRENPCLSRTEMPQMYARRKFVRDLDPNPQWKAVLKEYAKLHRTCMHRIGDPTAYYLNRNTSINCKFAVIDTGKVGLGNRLLVFASVFAYSLLTKRVVLVAQSGTEVLESSWLCEPFEGSSWGHFDPARKATPFHGENQYWNRSGSFLNRIDEAHRLGNSSAALSLVEDYAVANDQQPDSRFFCDTEQEYYKNVTWVYFNSCFNFLPKFFTVPSFRPILDVLFPDRMVLTRILRDVMRPADPAWIRVKNINRGYLEHTNRHLGVHVRYDYRIGDYNSLHETIAARVLQCAIANNILPPVQESTSDNKSAPAPPLGRDPWDISVFVASLYEGVKSNLTETFLRHPTATGDSVQVVQFSHEGNQKFGDDVYQEALAEVLTLSLSDFLFVTPLSTFSGIAQAYGGLVPWFIDFRPNITESGPCTRAQTVDVCFQVPFDYNIKCPYDPERHDKVISDVYPEIQQCLDVDTKGLQVITENDLSMVQA